MKQFLIVVLIVTGADLFAQRGNKPIQEDLSTIRPHFTPPPDTGRHQQGNPNKATVAVVQPRYTVNEKVNSVLDSIDRLNAHRRYIPGYTIQVYSGLNRDEAGNAKKKLMDELDIRSELQYMQPKFRVRTGYYFTALDAQKDLVRLKRSFPNAILVPESIPIK